MPPKFAEETPFNRKYTFRGPRSHRPVLINIKKYDWFTIDFVNLFESIYAPNNAKKEKS